MMKALLAGTTALVIAGSTLVLAQPRAGAPDAQRWRPTAEDISAVTDARIAALKGALKLTPDQEKNWTAYEQALRDLAKQRADRMAARRDKQGDARTAKRADPIERMRRRADAMTENAARLKKLADATQPLYQSLDESQKHRFTMLSHAMAPRHMAFAHWRQHRGPGERGPNAPR